MIEGVHFQNAYVTRNLDKAVAAFESSADIRYRFLSEMPVTTTAGTGITVCRIAFLWVGDLQYEFIELVSGPIDVYREALPADDAPVFHHICMRVPDWADFRARVDRQPWPVVLEGEAGALRFLYLDARPMLGHHVEYIAMPDEVWRATGGR